MTLITVFPYPDGTVIAADSQETVKDMRGNEFKYSVLKLKPETMGKFQVLIAGGGNGEAIDTFIEDCKQFFATSQLDNLADFKKAIQTRLKECRKDLRSVGDDNTMHLLIAAQIGQTYAVWKTKSHVLSEVTEPDMIGFTEYMYRHTVKEFQPNNLPVTQLILVSLRVLDFARQTSTCVDQPYSVVTIRNNGIQQIDDELIKHYMESVGIFGVAVNKLLLACGDTALRADAFDKHLAEFASTAIQLRKEYLQVVGERAFRRMLDDGSPREDSIAMIPQGSMISFSVDEKGNRIEVREQTEEESVHWKVMRDMCLDPEFNRDNKLLNIEDLRLIRCTNSPCPRLFFGRLVRVEGQVPVLEGKCPSCGKEYKVVHSDLT